LSLNDTTNIYIYYTTEVYYNQNKYWYI